MYFNAIDSVTGWVDMDTTSLVAVPALAERSGRVATRQDFIAIQHPKTLTLQACTRHVVLGLLGALPRDWVVMVVIYMLGPCMKCIYLYTSEYFTHALCLFLSAYNPESCLTQLVYIGH